MTAAAVDRICCNCGGSFSTPASRVRHGRGIYCSIACSESARRQFWSARESPRPIPEGAPSYPTYRLSDPNNRPPRRCPNGCGETLVVEAEYLEAVRLVCVGMCSRQQGWVLP